MARKDHTETLYRIYEFAFALHKDDKMLARNIMREVIFKRVRAEWSGLISEKAKMARTAGKRPTDEHYVPINSGVVHLFDRVEIASIDCFQEVVKNVSRVHRTTSEENHALKKFYRDLSFEQAKLGWQKCYADAGINLLRDRLQEQDVEPVVVPLGEVRALLEDDGPTDKAAL